MKSHHVITIDEQAAERAKSCLARMNAAYGTSGTLADFVTFIFQSGIAEQERQLAAMEKAAQRPALRLVGGRHVH